MLLVEAAVVEQQAVGLSGSEPVDKGEQVLQSEGKGEEKPEQAKNNQHDIKYIDTLPRGHEECCVQTSREGPTLFPFCSIPFGLHFKTSSQNMSTHIMPRRVHGGLAHGTQCLF